MAVFIELNKDPTMDYSKELLIAGEFKHTPRCSKQPFNTQSCIYPKQGESLCQTSVKKMPNITKKLNQHGISGNNKKIKTVYPCPNIHSPIQLQLPKSQDGIY